MRSLPLALLLCLACDDGQSIRTQGYMDDTGLQYRALWRDGDLEVLVFEALIGPGVAYTSDDPDADPQPTGFSLVPSGLYEDGRRIPTRGGEVFVLGRDGLQAMPVTPADLAHLRAPAGTPFPDVRHMPSWASIAAALDEGARTGTD